MVTKEECIEIFNAMIRGTPISFQDKLLPVISEYLTEINYEDPQKLISLIVQQPQMAQNIIPELVSYYCRKHEIKNILSKEKQIILYYE